MDYLVEQMNYWKKKAEKATNKFEKIRCEQMWGTFREKINKEKK